ncbi:MAG: MBL fold metallo-hydrolase, partial [Spirochaetales bacterium]|nr:MBL fold metallo-hydrolase [Spirochaetales bacterium]
RLPHTYFQDQESRYVHPFQIFGNVWYVGDSWVCVHLIDTGDGLLLLDGGNIGATAMLVNAIWEAGFKPSDVRWMVLSHGHLDHIGGAVFFRRMFGTKIYLGEPDARDFRKRPELSLVHEAGSLAQDVFEVDHEITDGERIRFGNTEIQFYLTPGHTDGVISAFFDVTDGKRTVRAGYFGGFGFNTMRKDFLLDIGDTEFRTRQVYLDSLAKVRNQKVELFLGNHCGNNHTQEKAEMLRAGCKDNPFIDSTEWGCFLDKKRDEMLLLMADPEQN